MDANKVETDLDLAPVFRIEANYWKSKYFEAVLEIRKANKGLIRLHRRIKNIKEYY